MTLSVQMGLKKSDMYHPLEVSHTDTRIQDTVQDSVVASRKVPGSIPNVLNRPIVSPLDREAHNNPYLLLHGHRRCFELFLLHIKVNSIGLFFCETRNVHLRPLV